MLTQLLLGKFLPPRAARRDEEISSKGRRGRGLQHTQIFMSRLEQVLHRGQVTETVTDCTLATEGCMARRKTCARGGLCVQSEPCGVGDAERVSGAAP